MEENGAYLVTLSSDEEDQEIVSLYFNRDEAAIRRTSEKYGRYLTAVALNILQSEEEAEECVDDAYFRAWHSIPPSRPTSLGAFLAKITRNLSLDRYRSRFAEKRLAGEFSASLDELADTVADSEEWSPDRLLDSQNLSAAINRFLRAQKPFARRVFVLRYFYVEPIRQIALRQHCEENLVKTTLSRTRKKLKTFLEKEGFVV